MLKKLKEAHEDYLAEVRGELKKEIERLQNLLNLEKEKMSGAAAQLEADLTAQIEDLKKKLATTNAQLKKVQNAKETAEAGLKKTEGELSESRAEVENLKQRIADL